MKHTLPITWRNKCEDGRFDDGHIVTNADIQAVMLEEIEELRECFRKHLSDAAAALAVVANHAKHPGCADQNNLASIRGFALEAFRNSRTILSKLEEV